MNQPAEAARGFRMRWWMWVVAVATILASGIIALHVHGSIQLERIRHDLRDLGLDVGPVEFVAHAPPIDPDRQDRALRIMHGIGSWPDKPGNLPFNDLQEGRPSPSELAQRQSMLHSGKGDATAMAAVMQEGAIVLTLFGAISRDPAKLAASKPQDFWAPDMFPNLMGCRGLANWWATSACLAEDPAADLEHLGRLAGSMHRPGSLIDAMIAIAIDAIRDQTRLYLATRGRLPSAELQAWMQEDQDEFAWMADAFAGERCLFYESYADLGISDMSGIFSGWSSHPSDWFGEAMALPYWAVFPHDCARGITGLAGVEAELRGLHPPKQTSMPFGIPCLLSDIALPNYLESIVCASEASYSWRMARIAAVIAMQVRTGGLLPDSRHTLAAMLPSGCLDADGPDHPAIAFEVLSPKRFRIGLDPLVPLPTRIPAGRWKAGYSGEVGKPASRKSWVRTRWSLEIDLDAILIPPPEKPAKAKK